MTYARFAAIIGMVALAIAVTIGSAQAAVEDVLLEKGIITKEDWLKIKAEKEQEIKASKEKEPSPQTNAPPAAPSEPASSTTPKEGELKVIEWEKEPTTGELIAGSGFQKIRYKDVYLAPGGFVEATSIFRSANQNADVGSTYGNIPISGTANSHLNEFRGTARQSRLSLLGEALTPGGAKVGAYVEFDFLGAAPTANEVESNSFQPRLRQFFANADFANGVSVMAGQGWTLLTTHRQGLKPRSEFIPYTIDAQYVVGYNWARQAQLRVTKDFGSGVWGAFSIENPETNVGGVVLPVGVQGFNGSANAQSPSSQFTTSGTPGAGGLSTDTAPDLIGKMVFEPGWGHWEIKALGRFFRDRLNGNNQSAFGGGIGGAAFLPIAPTLDLIAEGLVGSGIGRYAAAVGPDVAAGPDGRVVPIRSFQIMTGLEWHPSSAWDIYAYYGLEYYERTALNGANIGYGSPGADLSGCAVEIPGTCQAANKTVSQIQPGFWYRIFQGRMGTGAIGMSFSYTQRQIWSGQNSTLGLGPGNFQPRAEENMVMTSFRYYLP